MIQECNHCFQPIFECDNFKWIGEPLMYSPILCEKCGKEYNRSIGELTMKVEGLEKELEQYKALYKE